MSRVLSYSLALVSLVQFPDWYRWEENESKVPAVLVKLSINQFEQIQQSLSRQVLRAERPNTYTVLVK